MLPKCSGPNLQINPHSWISIGSDTRRWECISGFIDQKVLIFTQSKILKMFNPSTYGVGEPCRPLHVLVYCPLLKISLVNLIIPDLAKLFVADAPIKKNTKKIVLPPSQITLKFGIKNRPLFEGCNKHHKLCKFKADHQTWQNYCCNDLLSEGLAISLPPPGPLR